MSIFKFDKSTFGNFSVITNVQRVYNSSSSGVTGSVYVFPRRSLIEKDSKNPASFLDSAIYMDSIEHSLQQLQQSAKSSVNVPSSSLSGTLNGMLVDYLNKLDRVQSSSRKYSRVEIFRSVPTSYFTELNSRKLFIKDVLSPSYRSSFNNVNWGYTNYNCLSFYTSSLVPSASALLYPVTPTSEVHAGYVTGTYVPSGAFSLEFYINPRYKQDQSMGNFKAGTILHLSSCYAVSLLSGTAKDENEKTSCFKLQLQLSHSADVSPSLVSSGNYPRDLVFTSSDNCLKHNNWHHVVIRWGTNSLNAGTGSFVIDGIERGTFVVPSATIAPRTFSTKDDPSVLVIGNYYEGINTTTNRQSLFFARDQALRDGTTILVNSGGVSEPTSYSFNHPLNADLHNVSIWKRYITDSEIRLSASSGRGYLDRSCAFYLPVFFVSSTPSRLLVSGTGGEPQTITTAASYTSDTPFSLPLAWNNKAHYVNLVSYLKDFSSSNFPRLHCMSASLVSNSSSSISADAVIQEQSFVRRRNTLVMPCDDGNFVPDFTLLSSESVRTKYVDDLGNEDLSFVNLSDLVSTSSFVVNPDDLDLAELLFNSTPEYPSLSVGTVLQNFINSCNASSSISQDMIRLQPHLTFQRTRDESSDTIVMFNINSLYYGDRIKPGTLVLKDSSFSGSAGKLQITLKDDKYGNLYRSDCLTSASTWNSVGTIFYNEGVIVVKNPHLYFFGKDSFDISFQGERKLHVAKYDVLAPAATMNSSSNVNFVKIPPTNKQIDKDETFVYVSAINYHDRDFNVVMKAQLAQPILKRVGESYLFRVKVDF